MNEISPWRIQRVSDDEETDYHYAQERAENHVRDYWNLLRKRHRLLLLGFLAVFVFQAYITFSATEMYTAIAILKIEPQSPRVMRIEEVLNPSSYGGGQYDYYQTQFALLESPALAAKVIVKLGVSADTPGFNERVISGNLLKRVKTAFFQYLGWVIQLFRLAVTEASTYLEDLCARSGSRFAVVTRWFCGTGENAKEPTAGKRARAPATGEKEGVARADWFIFGVNQYLVYKYLSFLRVEPVQNTRLVRVGFDTPDPRVSQELANAHAETFIRTNLATRFELTKEAREFLEQKLAKFRANVQDSEAALQRFRATYGVVSLEKSENVVISRLQAVNSQLNAARVARIELGSLLGVVKGGDPRYLSEVIENDHIKQLKGRVEGLEGERARLATIFKGGHPRLVELDTEIDKARQRLNREIRDIVRGIEADYAAAQTREHALEAEANRQQNVALDLKKLEAEYAILQVAVDSNRTLYDNVLKRLTETSISTDISVSNINVTEPAVFPLVPSSPAVELNLLVGAIFGLMFGTGLVFIVEYLKSTLETPEDVWRVSGIPTLGVVPHMKLLRKQAYGYSPSSMGSSKRWLIDARKATRGSRKRNPLVQAHPFSIIAESYRNIRTALMFSKTENPPQVILLTSPVSEEGKTVTTLNLGITLAQGEHSVLVIDGDLRKGRCHQLLGQRNHKGLSNVLTGHLALEEGVQKTSIDNLSLLSSGVFPPNPADLLGSKKMKALLDVLRRSFDFILIDSPPVNAVTDAVVLSVVCDGVLLVLNAQTTKVSMVQKTIKHLEAVRAHMLGVVLNRVDIRNPAYAEYRHYARHGSYGTEAPDL